MLVLRRREGEEVVIKAGGKVIRVVLLHHNCRGEGVQIGFDADKDVTIVRKEVAERGGN
ncbi:carbon storage regulator [Planctomycetes bacterium Pan216]|uniref:Carbon storage regulator n=1 Tax=Kolteria novifilia TaxID=2527975 RepID=A0A518B2Q7_9BACT|nr:carbon storage regulator [Planctomycetes bacterium Pan216]